ncbi:MAG: hypothetical protein IJT02_09735 [Synergistaceae bacterium]|nr:hypothetical protein [Synergistaceae bacterium]
MKLVRERAGDFRIKPDRIGIVGFYAGALMAVYNAECAPAGSKSGWDINRSRVTCGLSSSWRGFGC